MANNENLIPIPGRLSSVATEGHVAGADEIYDDTQQKDQETINSELIQAVGTGGSVDSRIEAAINVEKTRAEEAESTLDAKITTEQTRATNAENALDGRVDTLEDAVGTGGSVDSRISAAVAIETTRAQDAEASLSSGKADKATTLAGYGITDAYTKDETYSKTEINEHITTPNHGYITAVANSNTTKENLKSLIDTAAGSDKEKAEFIYRVGCWDGSQYNDTMYSEYAWIDPNYVFLSKKSQIDEVFDISAYHANTPYINLTAALGTNGQNIPQSLRKGGMSVKFIQGSAQSSDNKYIQARCMAQNFTTDITQWQVVDDEPTAGSDNLVKSGGVASQINDINQEIGSLRVTYEQGSLNNGYPSSVTSRVRTAFMLNNTSGKIHIRTTAPYQIYFYAIYSSPSYDSYESTVSSNAYNLTLETGKYIIPVFKKLVSQGESDDFTPADLEPNVYFTWFDSILERLDGTETTTDAIDKIGDNTNLFRIKVENGNIKRADNTYNFRALSGQALLFQLMDNDIITTSISIYAIKDDGSESLLKVFHSPGSGVQTLNYNIKGLYIVTKNDVGTLKSGVCILKAKINGEYRDTYGTSFAQELITKGNATATLFKKGDIDYMARLSCFIPKGSNVYVNLSSLAGNTSSQEAVITAYYSDGTYSSHRITFSGSDVPFSISEEKDVTSLGIYTNAISSSDEYIQLNVKIDKSLLNILDDYNGRLIIPDYYFANNYLQNKVEAINTLLQSNSINSDTFIFQTDEHWEFNAKVSPALIKYIYDNTLVSKLFDGGDTVNTITNSAHRINPAVLEFETYRSKMFGGKIYHVMGNHEYLTMTYKDSTLFDNVDFNNWHDCRYFYDDEEIIYGDTEGHYYYVDNKQKKFRYIVLSSYKKKTPAEPEGSNYRTIAIEDFSQAQLNWFTSTALNVESGWTIVILTHMFSGINYTVQDDGHAIYVSRRAGAALDFAKAMLQYNGNGEIACVLAGHSHCDTVRQIDDDFVGFTGSEVTGKSIPEIITTADGLREVWGNNDTENPLGKVSGTITEQAFDVVNIDKVTKKITLIRVGCPAFDLFDSGNPLYGNLEYREVSYGNS